MQYTIHRPAAIAGDATQCEVAFDTTTLCLKQKSLTYVYAWSELVVIDTAHSSQLTTSTPLAKGRAAPLLCRNPPPSNTAAHPK